MLDFGPRVYREIESQHSNVIRICDPIRARGSIATLLEITFGQGHRREPFTCVQKYDTHITGIGIGYETAQLVLRKKRGIANATPHQFKLYPNKHVLFAVGTSICRAHRRAVMLMQHPDPSAVPGHSFRLSAHPETEVQHGAAGLLPPG